MCTTVVKVKWHYKFIIKLYFALMKPENFFELFLEELKQLPELHNYYKFHGNKKSFGFRKNYFLQRLNYIDKSVQAYQQSAKSPITIWDCGCGFGTTALFLAMNGIASYGSTLEYYYPYIEKRKKYWEGFGNSNLFTAGYEDIYQNHPAPGSTDIIIVQDTLHHLEPIGEALHILYKSLKPGGILLIVEENGDNIIQRVKLFKQRGSRRIITYYDEALKKEVLMGNENIRPYKQWEELLNKAGFTADKNSLQYIRYYLPFMYSENNTQQLAAKELSIKNTLLKNYFFFGINFIARKK